MVELSDRYQRAASLTGPKSVMSTEDYIPGGYWVDDSTYFLVLDRFDSELGRLIAHPCTASVAEGVVELLSPRAVKALLSAALAPSLEWSEISECQYDLPNRRTLWVGLKEHEVWIDLDSRRVTQTRRRLSMPALYAPDGRRACIADGNNLALISLETQARVRLTSDGVYRCAYGQASESSLAAISNRAALKPLGLWSPNSEWLLTHRIDERGLAESSLVQYAPARGARPQLHSFVYPLPGNSLPVATLIAIRPTTGELLEFLDAQLDIAAFSPFFRRRIWFSSNDIAWVVRQDRYCRSAQLIRLDLSCGKSHMVLDTHVESGYLDLHPLIDGPPLIRVLTTSNEVVWWSEQDGRGHLYLYDVETGRLKRQITTGYWMVRDIIHVDEGLRNLIVLVSGLDPDSDPARRSLCRVGLDDGSFTVLLRHDGDVFVSSSESQGSSQDRPSRPTLATAGVSPSGRFAVARCTNLTTGNIVQILELDTRNHKVIAQTPAAYPGELPRPFQALAADGVTVLHGIMFLPSDFDPSIPYPLIDYIYPGPQIAWQPQAYGAMSATLAMSLAELGFIVVMLDTRGTPIWPKAIRQSGYGSLLEPQLSDHACVLDELCLRYAYIDRDRIGVVGTSAGGAAAARAILERGELFKVAVAVAGNHDSSTYAAIWSDKYRGPPTEDAFDGHSNADYAHQLSGHLMLIAGDMDENVHIAQTLGLAAALIDANKVFDLLVVPNAGHDVLRTHGYTMRRVWDYFVTHLAGMTAPRDFPLVFTPKEVARFRARSAQEAP